MYIYIFFNHKIDIPRLLGYGIKKKRLQNKTKKKTEPWRNNCIPLEESEFFRKRGRLYGKFIESLSSTVFYKTCFTLLDSFGHPVKHRPALFCKTLLDDVLLCLDAGPLDLQRT